MGDDVSDSDATQPDGVTGPITVGIGEVSDDNDAGFEDPGASSISGVVFCDEDGSATESAGDTPVPGVVVTLIGIDGDSGDEVVLASTTTDADGGYTFTGLDAGEYQVDFPTAVDGKTLVAQDAGDDDTIDSDAGPDGRTDSIFLGINDDITDVDAGVEDPAGASISGRYFCDENDNDVDDGEPGISGAVVSLLDDAGNVVASTTTNGDGSYTFGGLAAGTYTVAFAADAEGKTFVGQDAGDDDTIDSDVDGGGVTDPISVGINESVTDVDAGVEDPGTASLAGVVFCDENGNAVEDGGDTRVPNVVVELLDGDGNVVGSTTTDADGAYEFVGLDAGEYAVRFPTAVDGKTLVAQDAGDDDTVDSDADQGTGVTAPVSLEIGERVEDIDAGVAVADTGDAEIRGRVFMDSDDDSQDNNNGDEMGIFGVVVELLDDAGNVVASTLTGPDGGYAFTGLDAGTYAVDFPTATQDGKVLVDANVGDDVSDSDATQPDGVTGPITVGIGEVSDDNDAGFEDPGASSISGVVFCDEDGSATESAGDTPVPGVVVTLIGIDGDSGDEVVLASTTTDADGGYTFTGLDAGEYQVDFPTAVDGKTLVAQDAGDDDTIDSDAGPDGRTDSIFLGINDDITDVDAGVEDPAGASISGRYFCDENDNDVDDGEPGVSGAVVSLLDDAGNVVASTTTNGDGSYTFGGLAAGTYTVAFAADADGKTFVGQDAGDDDTIDSDVDGGGVTDPISVGINESVTDVDAGVEDPGTASLAGVVFCDENGNAVEDGGDTRVPNVVVELLDGDGNVVGSTTTDADGAYEFVGLDAGEYAVRFPTAVDGKTLVAQDAGDDDTVDSDADQGTGVTAPVSLEIGERVEDIDAGVAVADTGDAEIRGRVFMDSDDDSQDNNNGDEMGIFGVVVELLDDAGNVVASTLTGPDGGYAFTGLDAGTYAVDFPTATQDGKVLVDANVGDDVSDSDATQPDGVTGPITVGIGEVSDDNDAGFEDPGASSISGVVFCDEDGSATESAGDTPVPGVVVTLIGIDGDSGDEVVLASTTTDADGGYTFTGLDAGEYQVDFPTAVDGKTLVAQDAGDDDTIDSDAGPDGRTDSIFLGINDDITDVDAGVEDPAGASISGRYFCDENDNDVDDGEPGVSGAVVSLLDDAGNVVASTTTNGDGSYTFGGLAAGTYTVAFAADADGKTFVGQDAGDDDTIDSDVDGGGVTDPISVGINESVTDVDAGVEDPGTASLAGVVFCDENGNAVEDGGDTRVPNVVVELLDGDGNVVGSTTTDADGAYEFVGLDAGEYAVRFPTAVDGKTLVAQDAGDDDTVDSDADQGTGVTAPVSLEIGERVEDIDAGVAVADTGDAEIRGRVFMDSDDDSQDNNNGDEMGIFGVVVELLDDAGNVVASTLTGPDGGYAFTGLDAGTYAVDFPTATQDGKVLVDANVGDDVSDSDATQPDGVTGPITVGIGEVSDDNDAGFEDPGASSISGVVFCDEDGSATESAGDTPVPGVVVTLIGIDGDSGDEVVLASTTTDADGGYTFTGLDAGEYQVDFPTAVDGKTLVAQDAGDDDTIDSDAGPDGRTDSIFLGINDDITDVDAGVEDPAGASISGRYFCDENDNDVDDGEPGVSGAVVSLLDDAGNVVASTTTNGDGSYTFGGLAAGTYTVAFAADADGKTFVGQDAGDDDTIDSDVDGGGVTDPISVGINESVTDVDAGVEDPGTASLAGVVFCDENGNAVEDGGDTRVPNVVVELLDGDGNVVGSTTTDADGAYEFVGLDAGEYAVRFPTAVDGKTLVAQDAGDDDTVDSDADQGTGVTAPVSLEIGERVEDIDAGVAVADTGDAEIRGRVFMDSDDDSQDNNNGDEMGIFGVVVELLDDAGNVVASTLTGPDGGYAFTGLDAGTYAVDFPTATQDGKVLVDANVGDDVSDSDATQPDGVTGPITVGIGEVSDDNDAGFEDPGASSISGVVFCDEDGSATESAGDTPVPGVVVTLIGIDGDSGDEVVLASTTTDADGGYTFTGLDAGEYQVDFPTAVDGKTLVAQDAGDDDTIDSDAGPDGRTDSIFLGINDDITDVDAGVEDPGTASLGDRVFIDANRNGRQDAGEVGLAGVIITLLDANGFTVGQEETDADGNYLFSGLDAGEYTVQFGEPNGFDFTTPNVGDDAGDSDADPTTGNAAPVTLAIGEENLTIDAGVVAENSDPTPVNDTGETCADDPLTLNVLANDDDPEGDDLTITQVDGKAITDGQTITTDSGINVTLNGEELVIDGEDAYAFLDINESEDATFSYTVADGNGGEGQANVTVTFKGDANDYHALANSFADITAPGSYTLTGATTDPDAFTLSVSNTGDERLDGATFAEAYCLDFFAPIPLDMALEGELLSTEDSSEFGNIFAEGNNGVSSFNNLEAAENMDLINYILAQDWTNDPNQDIDGWDVQFAIWELTNNVDTDQQTKFFEEATVANVDFILADAAANGEGFTLEGDGGIATTIIDPTSDDPNIQQPFIIAYNFDDYDCIC